MQKVINAHCHIYPEKIASKAVKGIRDFYDLDMSLNGKVDNLIEDGNKVGVVHYLVHSVATTPKQVRSINEFISNVVKERPDLFTGFGTLHPDSDDIEGDYFGIIDMDEIIEKDYNGECINIKLKEPLNGHTGRKKEIFLNPIKKLYFQNFIFFIFEEKCYKNENS